MKILTGMLFVLMVLFAPSCNKEEIPPFGLNCENLKNGIINSDSDLIGQEITKVLQGLDPKPTAEDIVGHEANFDILFQRLSPCDFKTAQIVCYFCGFASPPQSEVVITAYKGSEPFTLVIDIITPRDGGLSYKGIHAD
ncbi:MAG: hypothetical protein IPH69_06315 [Bacteroidales bacterium]|nr:hypothetical protein [Bacteroidales bacterium]